MRNNHLGRWLLIFFVGSFFFSTCTDGKGFGGGRGGGGFRGGSRGGSSKGGAGSFGGSSSYNRYGSANRPRSGSNFRSNAMSFGAGALGGVAAYSLMRSMSSSYHPGSGYYQPGYGTGETCVNNEDLNGTRFGSFRCPLNGFPMEAKSCCGGYGKQYCCIREGTNRSRLSTSNFAWIFFIVILCIFAICLFARHRRQSRKDVIMIPMEPPADEQHPAPFYRPPPPPMGYPPPPGGNPYAMPPQGGNSYAVPPQNQEGNFHSYQQQYQMPYPPPPQQPPYNPYQAKEGGPPAYDDAVRNNSGVPLMKTA